MKICKTCKVYKSVLAFRKKYKNAINGGLNTQCKLCENIGKRKYSKVYYLKNKTQINKWNASYQKKRKADDPEYRLKSILRCRLNFAVKNNSKIGSAVSDLGCSVDFFKIYIESQFKDGMTWENHSMQGWHLDHIIPLKSFNLKERDQFLKAVHYTNLQPLWAYDNKSKGSKDSQKMHSEDTQ